MVHLWEGAGKGTADETTHASQAENSWPEDAILLSHSCTGVECYVLNFEGSSCQHFLKIER